MKSVKIIKPEVIGNISPEIYGHFSEHIGGVFYGGLWVGKNSDIPNERGFRKDALEYLRRINVPVLRWPGGCFAETYNWRDGIGEDRPVRHNWWTRNDGRYESNEVGTHEFFDLCELIRAKAYLAINVTSITPLEAREWLDYCLSPKGSTTLAIEREKNGHPEPFVIDYIGVGNENWGGGGNMTPDYYALEYRKFATLIDNICAACGSEARLVAGGANHTDYKWTHDLAQNLADTWRTPGWGMSFHFYTTKAGDCVDYTVDDWNKTIALASAIEPALLRHNAITEGFGIGHKMKLVIDEWGCWHPDGSGPSRGYNLFEQQSTMRDAVVSALSLNVFNNHSDKVYMTNVAQVCNNLHCLLLCDGKDNLITTPTYHVFDMYKFHMGAEALRTLVDEKSISASASVADGYVTLTLANTSCECDEEFRLELLGACAEPIAEAKLLSSPDYRDCNTFDTPERVKPCDISVDITKPVSLPRASVLSIKIKLK